MSACNPQSSNQSWFLSPDGFLYNVAADRCMDVASDGLHLKPKRCQLTDQKWHKTPEGFIESQLSGLCMDVQGSPPLDMNSGAPLVLYPCEKEREKQVENSPIATDQQWTFTNGSVLKNRLSNKCVGSRGLDDGSPLVLSPHCEGHPEAHRWNLTEDGFFRSVLSPGRCIDVMGPAGRNSDQPLVLYMCEDQMNYTYQTWELVDQDGEPVDQHGLPVDKIDMTAEMKPEGEPKEVSTDNATVVASTTASPADAGGDSESQS
jgi:hypothetical protein